MYFETGQGSCLSAGAHHGVDQQTLEARAYAVARHFEPLLVNSVVGFIGPEYLADAKQITRAGLEDHFCGKLLGLPMGCDVCYTNHVDADQDDNDVLLTALAAAGCSFVMAVPGADDVMLGYQSTSHHDVQYVRQVFGLRPAPEFEAWLQAVGIVDDGGRLVAGPTAALTQRAARTLGAHPMSGEDVATWDALRAWTPARIGLGRAGSSLPTGHRLRFQMDHARARDAVWAELDLVALEGALRTDGVTIVRASTRARSREEHLLRPDLGRRLDDTSAAALAGLRAARR